MKILFVLENYYPHIGGVEVLFKNLTEGLVKKGYNVSIVTHRIKGTKRFEVINGVKVYRVNCFYNRYLFTFFSIPEVIKLAKDSDIIHTTTFNGAFPAWLASKITKKKCVITIHEVWVNSWAKLTEMGKVSAFLHNTLEKLIYTLRFDEYVAVSQSTKNQLLGVGVIKERASVIYNGIDYNHWNPKKCNPQKIERIKTKFDLQNDFVYFFSGRPGTSKGLEYLIKAVPDISKKIPHAKLVAIISRDKAYKKRYRYILKLINSLGIKDRIFIIDPVAYKELPYYIKAVDCVVVPSLAEGFGFVVAEACAMGVPVVASNVGSIPEVISSKYALVKPKDERSIAEGIIKVYRKKYNQTKLKRFTIEDNVLGYLNVYKGIK